MNIQTRIDAMPDGHNAARWFRRLTVAGFTFFSCEGVVLDCAGGVGCGLSEFFWTRR